MNKLAKILYAIILLIVSLLISTHSIATHYYYATLDELIGKSDLVFVGEVKTVGRTIFGYKAATIRIEENIKGEVRPDMRIKYGRPWFESQVNVPILIEGQRYLFFLIRRGNDFLLAGITGPQYYLIDDSGEVLCGNEEIPLNECIERGRGIVLDRSR